MKKLFLLAVLVTTITSLLVGGASAMVVGPVTGNLINGWYLDTFSVNIKYGNSTCNGPGTSYNYTFVADATYNGKHSYKFIRDFPTDNPYLSLDNNPPTSLIMSCPPTSIGTYILASDLGNIQLDAMAPQVSITNPPSGITTSSSTYLINGVVSDAESGVEGVKIIVNGVSLAAPDNGNTFNVTIPLNVGDNAVVAKAFDKVGHSTISAPITIKRTDSSTTDGGTTTPPTNSSSGTTTPPVNNSGSTTNPPVSSNSSTPSTTPATQSTPTDTNTTSSGTITKLKFNQDHILSLNDSSGNSVSDPNKVLADEGLGSTTARSTYIIIALILLILSLVMIWRFRPVFTKLDKHNSGLRRRIVLIVSLPSLIPLFGLGFLGYQQITHNTRAALSNQLAKAAQTASLKLEREFSIRSEVITKSSSDILQIKAQIKDQHTTLSTHKTACSVIVNIAIPKKQYASVTSNDDCLPFLTGFAQLASSSGAGVKDYLSALDQGETTAQNDLNSQEQQRVNEILGSVRHYFPDLYELTVVGADDAVTLQAELPPGSAKQPSILPYKKDLLKLSRSDTVTQFLTTNKPRLMLISLPILSDKKTIGGALVAIDIDQINFMPTIWRSTPKPYTSDVVFFVSSQGDLLYPTSGVTVNSKDLQKMSLTTSGNIFNLSDNKQNLTTRVSQVSGTSVAVGVGAPASSVLAPLAGVQQTAILAIISFIMLSIILGILFVSGIAGEIEKLLTGALNFSKGELSYRIGLKSHDELQTLGDTMDQMATDIKTAQLALIEKDKEFINIATHELKAPMTAIIGNLSMITEDNMGQVDEVARKLIGQAFDGTVRLRSLVSDMLDVARLDAGKTQFKLEPLDIIKESSAILAMQEIPAKQATVLLAYQPRPTPLTVLADKTKLQIILTNLVSNAIKYNRPNGTITVANEIKDNMVVTSVSDTGLGIPEDQQSHIFEKFYRVSHDDRKNVPGTGLGMYITKNFIEAMGGKIWFKSVHGQGTTFYFSLPTASTMTQEQPPDDIKTPQIPPTL
jgi:signal transduction histidine kinase